MSANITSKTLILRMLFFFFLITACLFVMFMIDGRSVAEFVSFLKFFAPLSAVLLGMFIIIYVILERKTSFHNSVRMLIAGIISYIATLGTIDFLYGLDLQDVILGALWVVLLGVVAIYETVVDYYRHKAGNQN